MLEDSFLYSCDWLYIQAQGQLNQSEKDKNLLTNKNISWKISLLHQQWQMVFPSAASDASILIYTALVIHTRS